MNSFVCVSEFVLQARHIDIVVYGARSLFIPDMSGARFSCFPGSFSIHIFTVFRILLLLLFCDVVVLLYL